MCLLRNPEKCANVTFKILTAYIEVHQQQEAFLQIASTSFFSKSVYTCATWNITLNKMGTEMVSFVNRPQSKVTWKESLNEGLSRSGWPVGMSLGNFYSWANSRGKTHLNGSIAFSWRGEDILLCLPLAMICDPAVSAALTCQQRWTVAWNFELKRDISFLNLFLLGYLMKAIRGKKAKRNQRNQC